MLKGELTGKPNQMTGQTMSPLRIPITMEKVMLQSFKKSEPTNIMYEICFQNNSEVNG